jgi:L-threonylcarbamoyladenylate synthase
MNATYNQITGTQPPSSPAIQAAADHLRIGGLVAFPTETVYGLGADARSAVAVKRVFDLKGRPAQNPLIVHVHSAQAARELTSMWPEEATLLARAFWPGPLTLVLPKASTVPSVVTGGGPNVAIRVPDHALTLELLQTFGGPLVGPSANPSGRISPTAASHVRAYFAAQEAMVLEGGACRSGIESTVLSLAERDESGRVRPVILRPGVISPADIAAALGIDAHNVILHSDHSQTSRVPLPGAALPGPGLLPQHYAPKTKAILCDATEVMIALGAASPRVAVIAWSIPAQTAANDHVVISLQATAHAYAANMYAALMRADAAGADRILIEIPNISDNHPIWQAVMDRLTRATS